MRKLFVNMLLQWKIWQIIIGQKLVRAKVVLNGVVGECFFELTFLVSDVLFKFLSYYPLMITNFREPAPVTEFPPWRAYSIIFDFLVDSYSNSKKAEMLSYLDVLASLEQWSHSAHTLSPFLLCLFSPLLHSLKYHPDTHTSCTHILGQSGKSPGSNPIGMIWIFSYNRQYNE